MHQKAHSTSVANTHQDEFSSIAITISIIIGKKQLTKPECFNDKGGKQMNTKWICILMSAVFLAGIPAVGAMAQQGERVKVSEAEKQRVEQLAKEQAEARKRMEAEKMRQQAAARDKQTAKPAPTQGKPRIDDSTLQPGAVVPKEIPAGQPPKPKRDPLIR